MVWLLQFVKNRKWSAIHVSYKQPIWNEQTKMKWNMSWVELIPKKHKHKHKHKRTTAIILCTIETNETRQRGRKIGERVEFILKSLDWSIILSESPREWHTPSSCAYHHTKNHYNNSHSGFSEVLVMTIDPHLTRHTEWTFIYMYCVHF